MAFFGSSWNEDSDDYDGPLFGSGLSDHLEKKEIRKQLQKELELDEVPDHLVNERFELKKSLE